MTLNRNDVINAYKIWLDREASDAEIDEKWRVTQANNWGWPELSNDMKRGSDEFDNKVADKIDWWFSEESGYGINRDPTQQERDDLYDHIFHRGWEHLDEVEPGLRELGAATDDTPPPNTGDTGADNDSDFIIPGKGGPLFGGADYNELLKRTDGSVNALKRVRNDVLNWIRDHPNKDAILASHNQPNSTPGENDDGLYERINTGTPDFDRDEGGRFFTQWGDPDVDVDKDTGVSSSDIRAWKAGGHSTFQIYSYMNRNKSQWKDSDSATTEYNTMRQELIDRGNTWGNMHGAEDGQYSWKNTFENPLFQELGKYIKSSGIKDDKSIAWWMYDKDAYEETIDWLNERHHNYDWLEADDSGHVIRGPRTQEELQSIIGSSGVVGTGGVGVPTDWEEGDYWKHWGEAGPRKDGKLDLAEVQKISGGLGLGWLNINNVEIEKRLEEIEQRFLKEMYVGGTIRTSSGNVYTGQQVPELDPKYHHAEDSWGLDIVRKNMNPDDWKEDWFEDDIMDNSWYRTLVYGDENTIDWGYYQTNSTYKAAQKALGMDDKIDEISEIREANTYVYAKLLADEESDHLEEWIPYEPTFDNNTRIPDPIEIDVGDYETPAKRELTPAPDRPEAPTINIPRVNVTAPDTMPSNLKIAGGEY